MAGITLEKASMHLDAWLEAELELTTHQSYTIGSRTLTKADLGEVRKQIEYWNNWVLKLNNASKNKGRNRVMRAVPRDL